MAWKVRKEKQQTDTTETEPNETPGAAPAEEAENLLPVFDLSGDAFRTVPESSLADDDEFPTFPTVPASDDTEPISLASGMMTMDAETGIPRVAPFIIDVPPASEQTGAGTITALVVHLGKLTATFPLIKETTVIGRPDPDSDSAPDVEIELDDAISRHHAEIRRHGDFYLVDLNSTNGTRLNGEALPPLEERRLAQGDRIQLGERTEITVE